MARKMHAVPQAALASVKKSARWNSRIIEKCLGLAAMAEGADSPFRLAFPQTSPEDTHAALPSIETRFPERFRSGRRFRPRAGGPCSRAGAGGPHPAAHGPLRLDRPPDRGGGAP